MSASRLRERRTLQRAEEASPQLNRGSSLSFSPLDCRAGSAVSGSQSGEAEKRPAGCASAGAGGRAQGQGAGEAPFFK